MLRIDAHQHFWRYDPAEYAWIDDSMRALQRDFLPPDLEPELRGAGFDGCVAVQARQTIAETRFLLDLATRHRFIVGVVGWVDLQAPGVAQELEALRNDKLVGVRHIVQAEPDDRFLLRREFCRGIEQLEGFGLAYDILIYPRHLPAAAEFAARFPQQRFVLDHLAKPVIRNAEIEDWRAGLARLAALPNVFCKVSGLVTEADWHGWTDAQLRPYLDATFASFGPDRLMIGSDWPVCTVAGSYARTMRVVLDYIQDRPEPERDAVLGGNAARFWKLDLEETKP